LNKNGGNILISPRRPERCIKEKEKPTKKVIGKTKNGNWKLEKESKTIGKKGLTVN
jgi:hypothetical protein